VGALKKLYVKRFTQGNVIEVDGFEMPVRLPDMPARSTMQNFYLPERKQKFQRTVVPKDLEQWQKPKREEFIANEWHKRLNGIWILIKGEPVYLTGAAYVFFNYWYMETGNLPTFRMEAVEYFWVSDMAELDHTCFGLLDIKCRRVGDTEKEIFLGWEMCTRYRNSWFGMQNQSDTDAKANFQRAVLGAQRMPFFFAPVLFAGDTPQGEMIWRFPQNRVAGVRIDRKLELGSKMDFRPTKERLYDGKRLRRYHLDEPGKISPVVMNCHTTWQIVRLCLSLNNGQRIIGKAALTTTVEELGDGASVTIMQKLWDESNPNDVNELGRTTSGLWRIFRGYLLGADVDEYGFHKRAEAKRMRDIEIENLRKRNQYDQIVQLKRKQPANIHEALATSGTDCILGAHLIDEQISVVEEMIAAGRDWPQRPVTGDFVWSGVFGSPVLWKPSPHGKFEVSSHPPVPNKRIMESGGWVPDSVDLFAAGADPIDHITAKKTQKKVQFKEDGSAHGAGSDGALTIGAMFNDIREMVPLEYDEHGNILNTEEMITNRCVCIYAERPFNPYVYYEECLKALIYFGCKVNIETQKPGMISWMIEKGFIGYLAKRPIIVDPKALIAGGRKSEDIGTPATPGSIDAYVGAIKRHNSQFIGTHTHLRLLRDMRQFNGQADNRTKRDLTVAWGNTLTMMNNSTFEQEQLAKTNRPMGIPFSLFAYDNN